MSHHDSDIYVSSIHFKYVSRLNSLKKLVFSDFEVILFLFSDFEVILFHLTLRIKIKHEDVTKIFIKMKDVKGKLYKGKNL